jgi:hypothetical protein
MRCPDSCQFNTNIASPNGATGAPWRRIGKAAYDRWREDKCWSIIASRMAAAPIVSRAILRMAQERPCYPAQDNSSLGGGTRGPTIADIR